MDVEMHDDRIIGREESERKTETTYVQKNNQKH